MQWDATAGAGFTTGTPWLPIAADYARYNVASECDDPSSMLTLCQQLLALRRSSPALSIGSYSDVPCAAKDIFSYMREHNGERLLVVLNFSDQPRQFTMPSDTQLAEIVLSTMPDRRWHADPQNLELGPNEGVILRM